VKRKKGKEDEEEEESGGAWLSGWLPLLLTSHSALGTLVGK
jgi:hypothetical protein